MIKVDIRPRQDDLFDIYVQDGDNDEDLLNSSQGYEDADKPVALARRLFAARDGFSDAWNDDDPVHLKVTYRNGTTLEERIR